MIMIMIMIMITVMLKQEFDETHYFELFPFIVSVPMDLLRDPDNPFPQEPIWHDLACEEPNFLLSKKKKNVAKFCCEKSVQPSIELQCLK